MNIININRMNGILNVYGYIGINVAMGYNYRHSDSTGNHMSYQVAMAIYIKREGIVWWFFVRPSMNLFVV